MSFKYTPKCWTWQIGGIWKVSGENKIVSSKPNQAVKYPEEGLRSWWFKLDGSYATSPF